MKVVFLTGSHPRHLFLAKKIEETGMLAGLLIEERAAFIPQPPAGLNELDRNNFIRHFADRAAAEEAAFGQLDRKELIAGSQLPSISVSQKELNSPAVLQWVKGLKPDLVITYGVHLIKEELLSLFPEYAWNIHGGLSPWYRGNITHFWPFYFLQPNWTGMTIHYLTDRLDGGEIVHHAVPQLKYGDGIHDVAARAVVQVAEDLQVILNKMNAGESLPKVKQQSSGKLFMGQDWKPQHLRLIYNTFNNDIVDHYLDGRLGHTSPSLVNALD